MQVLAELQRLVAFPTVSQRPLDALLGHLGRVHAGLGAQVESFALPGAQDRANLVARLGPDGPGGLVLSGHLDVVPVVDQPWTSDPFTLTQRQGQLVGRGSADMKGFVAATLCALQRIPAHAYRAPLVLVWTCDEEIGCLGSAALVTALQGSDTSLPRSCLIGEPTDFQILRMHPGHVALRVHLQGHAAHSSRPDLGINAIAAAGEVIDVVSALAHELEAQPADLPELPRPWVAVNIALIAGGSAINIVPDRCTIDVGYRPLPGQAAKAVFNELSARLAQRDIGAHTELLRITPAMLTPTNTPLEHTLRQHARHPAIGSASFATDGGNLCRLGLQPLIFGPGSIEVAHQPDEALLEADLHHAVDVIEAVVRTTCC